MLTVCRAEDGQAYEVNATLRTIERLGSLEAFLHQETGVPEDAVLAYLSDGRRLENANVREIAWGGSEDVYVYVFNKMYLDMGVEEVMNELRVEDGDAVSLWTSMQHQHNALQTASLNLSLSVLTLENAWSALSTGMLRELDGHAKLISGVDADLAIISRVRIHNELLRVKDNNREGRTLGDYVSTAKMRQVADACKRAHHELTGRFGEAESAVVGVREREGEVRDAVGNKSLLEEVRTEDVQSMVDAKNSYTHHLLVTLKLISSLNHTLTTLPPLLSSLQASFKPTPNNSTNTGPLKPISLHSFTHLSRLHSMVYAYGATLVEIVRRRHFRRLFMERAQGVVDVMAKMAAAERKRRVAYRSDVGGVVPFEVKGLRDVSVEGVDVRVNSGAGDDTEDGAEEYTIDRPEVEAFMALLAGIERDPDPWVVKSASETRVALQKLILKMDGMEDGFDRIAERSLLSASRISHSRRRSIEADQNAYNEIVEQLRDANARDQAVWQEERLALKGDTRRLEARLAEREDSATREQEERESLRRDLDAVTQERDDLVRQLRSTVSDKDRQLADYERAIRDHLAEADGDRAVLERRYAEVLLEKGGVERELEARNDELEECRRQLEELQDHLDVANSDASGLRTELSRVEDALRRERTESDTQHSHTQRLYDELVDRFEGKERLVAELVDVAMSFRDAHARALGVAQGIVVAGQPGKHQQEMGMRMSLNPISIPDPVPLDVADSANVVEVLRAQLEGPGNGTELLDTLGKLSGVIRKWQKQCKEYRERAKGRIVFRNFAKGDLALFLPTRGGGGGGGERPWAAFNVFFPHYFLQATGPLGEQLRTREWIVARITSIAERIVDHHNPESNPYGLSDGVKYYMLQVEDWTQQPGGGTGTTRRKSSGGARMDSIVTPVSTFPPPEVDVEEDTFQTPFPSRVGGSPPARPSSLSRLLAQADDVPVARLSSSPEEAKEEVKMLKEEEEEAEPKQEVEKEKKEKEQEEEPKTPAPRSPVASNTALDIPPIPSVPIPASPSSSSRPHIPLRSSPLRPGSRASSRFSVALGPGGGNKAALAEAVAVVDGGGVVGEMMDRMPGGFIGVAGRARAGSGSSSIRRGEGSGSGNTPSPNGSMGEGLVGWRRRTTSYHSPSASEGGGGGGQRAASASSTLANLASSWGVAFGRKRKEGVIMEAGGSGEEAGG